MTILIHRGSEGICDWPQSIFFLCNQANFLRNVKTVELIWKVAWQLNAVLSSAHWALRQCEVFVLGGIALKLSAYCSPFAGSVPLLIPADWSVCLFFFPLMWKSKLGPLVFPHAFWVHSQGLAAWCILWWAVGCEVYEGGGAVCPHSISCQRNNMYKCHSVYSCQQNQTV